MEYCREGKQRNAVSMKTYFKKGIKIIDGNNKAAFLPCLIEIFPHCFVAAPSLTCAPKLKGSLNAI